MIVSLIVATDRNFLIGRKNGELPWHISVDLKKFRSLTRGHTVIMGKKTFLSLGKPLPKRENIVVTTDKSFYFPGVSVFNSLEESLGVSLACGADEVFVIGGADTYRRAIPFIDRLYITTVDCFIPKEEGDVLFPVSDIDMSDWNEVSIECVPPGEDTGGYRIIFSCYEKKGGLKNETIS